MEINPYPTKANILAGTNLKEVEGNAVVVYKTITSRTKRNPYVRSAYFREKSKKQKIFFDYFWKHLYQKPPKERFKRLKYFKAAIELIENSRNSPAVKPNANKPNEVVYRFCGITKEKKEFFIQIKENKKTGRKYFMSCFPAKR